MMTGAARYHITDELLASVDRQPRPNSFARRRVFIDAAERILRTGHAPLHQARCTLRVRTEALVAHPQEPFSELGVAPPDSTPGLKLLRRAEVNEAIGRVVGETGIAGGVIARAFGICPRRPGYQMSPRAPSPHEVWLADAAAWLPAPRNYEHIRPSLSLC